MIMTRELLLEKICPAGCTNDCVSLDCNRHCYEILNKFLDEYDKHIIEQYKADTNLKDTIKDIHDNVSQEMYCKGIDDMCNEISTYRMYDEYGNVIDLLEIVKRLKEQKWAIIESKNIQ